MGNGHVIAPKVDSLLTYAEISHESLYGTIAAHWKLMNNENEIEFQVLIPPNTSAKIILPLHPEHKIEKVGSGKYTYKYKIQ